MNTISFILSALLAATALGSVKDRVKNACKQGNYAALKTINCADIKQGWFDKCLKNKDFNKDGALAEAIRHCPDALPRKDKKLEKAARHLYKYNQLQSLRVLLADGRCKKLGSALRDYFLRDKELNVVEICKQETKAAGIVPGAPAPVDKTAPPPPPTALPAHEGSLKDWDERRLGENKAILASITPQQAAELGQCNNACLGFTADHFAQAGARPEVVASLSVRCFRNIPPAAFAGLTKAQVKAMTIWPFIRRVQLKAIKPESIVALPFDQLGIGMQNKKNAERHACFGISKEQLKAIRKDKNASKLYKSRCIKNSAVGQAPISQLHYFMVGAMALMLVL